MSGALVVGLGTPERRDDGVGLIVVERLQEDAPAGVVIRSLPRQALDLLSLWARFERVWVVDAIQSGAPAGTCHRVQPPLPASAFGRGAHSTHGLGLAESIALAESLGVLPAHLVVYGIEAGSVTPGEGLTPPVAAAVPKLVAQLRQELKEILHA
ncbi:MAG: hydrogenase maturation protease [Pseudomonadota bacterium]|nr:hydrogenase maturation protease [Pseudomonadota bacterium]